MKRLLRGLFDLPRALLLGVVSGYRLLLKPWLGNACRFEPSCSQYALNALQGHGALLGSGLTGYRLLRCHPWCDGGFDPVPESLPLPSAKGLFTRLGLGAGAQSDTTIPDVGTGAPAPARPVYREPCP